MNRRKHRAGRRSDLADMVRDSSLQRRVLWKRFGVIYAVSAILASTQVLADAVAEPPSAFADRVTGIALQRLEVLDDASRERIRETRSALDALISQDMTDPKELAEAYGRLGALYAAYSLSAAAESAFRNARQLDPNDFRWLYYSAHLALEFGEANAALGLLAQAAALAASFMVLASRM